MPLWQRLLWEDAGSCRWCYAIYSPVLDIDQAPARHIRSKLICWQLYSVLWVPRISTSCHSDKRLSSNSRFLCCWWLWWSTKIDQRMGSLEDRRSWRLVGVCTTARCLATCIGVNERRLTHARIDRRYASTGASATWPECLSLLWCSTRGSDAQLHHSDRSSRFLKRKLAAPSRFIHAYRGRTWTSTSFFWICTCKLVAFYPASHSRKSNQKCSRADMWRVAGMVHGQGSQCSHVQLRFQRRGQRRNESGDRTFQALLGTPLPPGLHVFVAGTKINREITMMMMMMTATTTTTVITTMTMVVVVVMMMMMMKGMMKRRMKRMMMMMMMVMIMLMMMMMMVMVMVMMMMMMTDDYDEDEDEDEDEMKMKEKGAGTQL